MPLPLSFLVSLIIGGTISLAVSQALRTFFGISIDIYSMISLTGIITFFGVFFFRVLVWADTWGLVKKPQTVVHKTERTPFEILMDAMSSGLSMLFFGGLFVAAVLLFTGNEKLLAQILVFLAQKLVRILEAIFF